MIAQARDGVGEVLTDPLASPTGFPFKVAQLENTASALPIYQQRTRVCDLGYLREPYAQESGSIGYRCAAEPVANFVSKGGREEDAAGRKCLCNALLANVGHPQVRKDGSVEPALLTVGDDLNSVAQFLAPGQDTYSAERVVERLLSLESAEVSREQASALPVLAATA